LNDRHPLKAVEERGLSERSEYSLQLVEVHTFGGKSAFNRQEGRRRRDELGGTAPSYESAADRRVVTHPRCRVRALQELRILLAKRSATNSEPRPEKSDIVVDHGHDGLS